MISDGDDLSLREKTALRSLWRLSSSGQKHRLHSGRLRSTGPMEHGQVQHTSTLQYFKVQTADSREQTAYSLQPTAYLSLMYSVQPAGLQHNSSPDGVFEGHRIVSSANEPLNIPNNEVDRPELRGHGFVRELSTLTTTTTTTTTVLYPSCIPSGESKVW